MQPVRGIIFDLDGTLVDSRLDFDAMRKEMGLPPGMPILEGLATTSAGPQRERMIAIMREHELKGADESVLIEGVSEFLQEIARRDISSAILTRNSRECTDRTLNRWNLTFSQVITREDAAPKPDPAGPRLIADRWGIPVQQIIVIGDYLFDLQAGQQAGMRSVLFAPKAFPDYSDQADFILTSFHDAAPLLDRISTSRSC